MTWLIDLLAARRGWLAFALSAVTVLSVVGASRVEFDDGYRTIFRSQRQDYLDLQRLAERFGSNDNDLVILFEAPDLLTRDALVVIQAVHQQLAAAEDIESVHSIVSLPKISSLLQEASTTEVDFAAFRGELLGDPLLSGRLLSADGRTALAVAYLGDEELTVPRLESILGDVRTKIAAATAGSGVRAEATGIPVMRVEIVRGVQHDQLGFTAAALVLGAILAFVIFRSVAALFIVSVPPAIGVVWTMGTLGWVGEPINVINNVLPALVLVIGFTDSVHLLFFIQRERAAGLSSRDAALSGVRHVGLACALTSLTTAIGFGSLALARVDMVQRFGLACAGGAALSFLAVVTAVPLLAGTRLGDYIAPRKRSSDESSAGGRIVSLLEPLWAYPKAVVAASACVFLLCLYAALQLRPDYRYREYLPSDSPTYDAIERRESTFGGTMPVHAWIEWPEGESLESERVLELIGRVEAIFRDVPEIHATSSIRTLLEVLPGDAGSLSPRVPFLGYLPADTVRRWFDPEMRGALVTGLVPDVGSAALNRLFDDLDAQLSETVAAYPGFSGKLAGLGVVSTRSSILMIGDLARSLGTACLVIFGVIALVFRSLRLALISLLPNALPLVGCAALLYWAGIPLRYTTVTLFSVGLGLAVDDTIHLLTAYRRERARGADTEPAVQSSVRLVGRAVITTTALLVIGFGALGLSGLPMMRLWGYLACACLIFALLADLIVLPALLLTFCRSEAKS